MAQSAQEVFVSYSANAEDVILHRLFGRRDRGFYVDVGAAHPTFENDTRALYDRGWTGINVEPNGAFFPELARHRPRDQNFQLALSDEPGTLSYWEITGTGLSTCDSDEAARARAKGMSVQETRIACTTLARLLNDAHGPAIDLLKIDVEGFELRVLQGNDWTRYRPSVVIVEATYPETATRRPDRVRPFLEQNGYDFRYFDGLNDFFVERGFEVPEGAFLPPNVFDHVVPYTVAALREHAANLERTHADQAAYVESLRENAAALEAERAEQAAELARLAQARTEQDVYLASLRTHLDAMQAERDRQTTHIAEIEHVLAARESARGLAEAQRDQQLARIAELEQGLAEAMSSAASLETRAAASEAEIATLQSAISRAEAHALGLTRENARLLHGRRALDARAARDRAEAVQALEAAGRHGEEVIALKRQLSQAAQTESRLHRSVADHVAALRAAETDLRNMWASTSWRITAPLRRLSRLVRRIPPPHKK